ncbi:energy transducer TonB [Thioalkalivibrio denitrificans]|uniref:Energy transducer TonB n=1 Tax=Thioalkalivibrio denitrificans TaxID=108003 RepID=A0A1V3NUN1_9GAMM|nr:energy transducer TonB [Thioalkalivibrio denitrificans]OOG28578.1 energy transducer TonB [Thioalkalivibrio denitrificans]
MSAVRTAAAVTPADRLGLTLFLAAVIHGIVILGVGFGIHLSSGERTPPMIDVVLVQTESPVPPEETERIAQVDQLASGQAEEPDRPSAPLTAPLPLPTDGEAQEQVTPATPQPEPVQEVPVLTREEAPTPAPEPEPVEEVPPRELPTADRLVERSLEMARLSSEISDRTRRYAERPRIHYVDALSARSAVEAAYIESWVRKVERVGNLNYPDEARRNRLDGSLILNVLLDHEGRVLKVEVASGSGHQVLDDAARRIVELSSPFAPFPAEMRQRYDQLMITRTWVFQGEARMRTR